MGDDDEASCPLVLVLSLSYAIVSNEKEKERCVVQRYGKHPNEVTPVQKCLSLVSYVGKVSGQLPEDFHAPPCPRPYRVRQRLKAL